MKKRSLRSFDRSLPLSLLRAREAVMKKFIPALREHDLSSQQWRVIRALEHEDGQEMAVLSERCFLLPPSLSRIIQNLEGRGFIYRKTVASDQRRSAIFLSKAGRDVYEKVAPLSAERYEYIADRLGTGKLELLYELLDELVEKIESDVETEQENS